MGVRLADIHLSQTLRKAGALCTGTVTKCPVVWNEGVKRFAEVQYQDSLSSLQSSKEDRRATECPDNPSDLNCLAWHYQTL